MQYHRVCWMPPQYLFRCWARPPSSWPGDVLCGAARGAPRCGLAAGVLQRRGQVRVEGRWRSWPNSAAMRLLQVASDCKWLFPGAGPGATSTRLGRGPEFRQRPAAASLGAGRGTRGRRASLPLSSGKRQVWSMGTPDEHPGSPSSQGMEYWGFRHGPSKLSGGSLPVLPVANSPPCPRRRNSAVASPLPSTRRRRGK